MKRKLLLWLLRFSYKNLQLAVKNGNGNLPDGIPTVRDIFNQCTGYAPRKRNPMVDHFECGGDGHYLCKECALFVKEKQIEESLQ